MGLYLYEQYASATCREGYVYLSVAPDIYLGCCPEFSFICHIFVNCGSYFGLFLFFYAIALSVYY